MRELLSPPEWLVDLLWSLTACVACTVYVGKPVFVWYFPDRVWWSHHWLSLDDREVVVELMEWAHQGRPPGPAIHRAKGRAAVRLVVAITVGIGLVAVVSRSLGGPAVGRPR